MTNHSTLHSQTIIHFIVTFSKVLCMYLNYITNYISFIFQRKMKFIAKSTESCEKAKEWLQAHAYPAVCTLGGGRGGDILYSVMCSYYRNRNSSAPVLCTELIIVTKFMMQFSLLLTTYVRYTNIFIFARLWSSLARRYLGGMFVPLQQCLVEHQ